MKRTVAVVIGAVLTGLSLTACSSGGADPAPTVTVTVTAPAASAAMDPSCQLALQQVRTFGSNLAEYSGNVQKMMSAVPDALNDAYAQDADKLQADADSIKALSSKLSDSATTAGETASNLSDLLDQCDAATGK
ncbi:hypothetical protein ACFT5B_11785 [Luteimicrobium sp. NPDC057192]|uniref:hypothetical protein n=1 Tax=Luteimicrobium sp. NPDC057192 TaxID=3346042 RepID=UPI00363302A9